MWGLGGEKHSYSSCVNIWWDVRETEKGSPICAACKCNQRQSDDTHSPQIMQLCILTDLFIKNTCLTLGNYMWTQNTLSPLENVFHCHSLVSHVCVTCYTEENKCCCAASSLLRKQYKFALLSGSSDDITEKQTFLCPAPLVGFLHPHLRGDRRTPRLPLLSNTARMPPGG